jgi:phosphoadenosine phosphosulfate reductase
MVTDFKTIFPTLLPKIQRPFEEKLVETNEIIRHHFEEFTPDTIVDAWIGGKDSTLLLRIVLDINPNNAAVFNNTGVELPETIGFIRQITAEWKVNLIETRPYQKTFWDCVKEYGYPKGKSERKGRYGRGGHKGHSDRCCYYLKERPMMIALKERGWGMIFLGTLAAESRQRQIKASQLGTCYHAKAWNCCKVHPLLWWTDEEVRAYTAEKGIPMNPIYAMGMGR